MITEVPLAKSEATHFPFTHTAVAEAARSGDDDSLRTMLETIRQELNFAEQDEGMVATLYDASRLMGDTALYKADTTQSVVRLLDYTRYWARPASFNVMDEGEHLDGVVDSYGMALRFGGIEKTANDLSLNVVRNNVELKNPSDAYVVSAVHIAGHESGHAILNGVGQVVRSRMPVGENDRDQRLLATGLFLKDNPEYGLTGNWETDVWIQEERFAEGYGLLAVSKTLELLGYSQEEASVFIDALTSGDNMMLPEGLHQIDHVDNVSANKSIIETLEAGGVNRETQKEHGQDYRGQLGYDLPSSSVELVEQIRKLHDYITQDNLEGVYEIPNPNEWEEAVHAQQAEELKAYIVVLKAKRQEALEKMNSDHGREKARLLRRAAGRMVQWASRGNR
jgi:hypothetical protein